MDKLLKSKLLHLVNEKISDLEKAHEAYRRGWYKQDRTEKVKEELVFYLELKEELKTC